MAEKALLRGTHEPVRAPASRVASKYQLMFSGIVQHSEQLAARERQGPGNRVRVRIAATLTHLIAAKGFGLVSCENQS